MEKGQSMKKILLISCVTFLALILASGWVTATSRAQLAVMSGSVIAAGGEHTCAVPAMGGEMCWGGNVAGQLGDGTEINCYFPDWVSGFDGGGVGAINVGYLHSCALVPSAWSPLTGGGVKCWGWNYYGQLGDGTHAFSQDFPVSVVGYATSGATALVLGESHTCILTTAGGVKCWGHNLYGELGNNSMVFSSTLPVDVYGLSSGMVGITAGSFHTCALPSVGGAKCWGANGDGQLGDGTTISSTVPVDVHGLTGNLIAMAGGTFHTCALTATGGVKCWGLNSLGQLGDGTNENHHTPVDVVGLSSPVIAITAGNLHTCALTSAGSVMCWGYNLYGQLGDGTTTDSNTPVAVNGLGSGVVAIDAGTNFTCAVKASGSVMCWGRNQSGQLGNDAMTESHIPVEVAAYPNHFLLLPVIYH
jgi:alpha-tubulin suppressor-like RCC1 family protein